MYTKTIEEALMPVFLAPLLLTAAEAALVAVTVRLVDGLFAD